MFSDVLNAGLVTSVNVDTNQADKLLRLLDTVVIKLEGGTDEDLKVLDEKPNIEQRPEPPKESLLTAIAAKAATPSSLEAKEDGTEPAENDVDGDEVNEIDSTVPNETSSNEKVVEEKLSKKRKRTTSGSSSSSSSSTSSSGEYSFFSRFRFMLAYAFMKADYFDVISQNKIFFFFVFK